MAIGPPSSHPRAVPPDRSLFIGRRLEVDRTRRLLEDARLVTLVGTGGVGKTRLAARVATSLEGSFAAGTPVVELGTVHDPALLAPQVAQALDVHDLSGTWVVGRLAEVIAERKMLLVLDNCEHLLEAVGVLVDALLLSCPHLRVLATSRRPLGIEGEAVLPVHPLPTPPPDAQTDAYSYDAVRLLVARAQAAAGDIEFGRDDAAALAELCRRLDGIPLAIELAAVRLRALSIRDVLARLSDRLDLLSRSTAAVPERHRSLRATMEWSAELLSEPEQLLWCRASVFADSFDVAAAEAVCADSRLPSRQILDALTGLVDASLLDVVRHGIYARFRMLDTVRTFGSDRLASSGEEPEARQRHVNWCTQMTGLAAKDFITPRQVEAFDRLDREHAELSAAMNYCLEEPSRATTGLRMACDLWLYWTARGHLTEGRRLVEALLAACSPGCEGYALGLTVGGFLALAATDPDAAEPLLEQGHALGRACGDRFTVALATQYLGQAAMFKGDLARADELLRRAAELHVELNRRNAAFCMADVGMAALFRGELGDAEEALRESILMNEGGDPWTRSHALWGLSMARLLSDAPADAEALARQALQLMRLVGDRSGIARCVETLSWAAAARGECGRAARLSGAAAALWRSIPAEIPAPLAPFRARYSSAASGRLGQKRWAALHEDGRQYDRAAAVALALGEDRAVRPVRSPGGATILTTRQRQVAELVAQGLTDSEIAAQLVISRRTARSQPSWSSPGEQPSTTWSRS